jgi:hypothetical protein
MQLFLNVYFTDPQGNQKQDGIFLNRGRKHQWISYSPHIGSQPSGDTGDVDWLGPKAIYLMQSNSVSGLINGMTA